MFQCVYVILFCALFMCYLIVFKYIFCYSFKILFA
nr:MAG TPA: hypothetical protein [Caudoviricetes sp.]